MSPKTYTPPKLETRTYELAEGLSIDYAITERAQPQSLLVFMPAALDKDRPDRSRPTFSRWSWANHFSDSTVISIADPALAISPELDAAWFLHDELDLIALISQFISEYARAHSIPEGNILFYGTSLGGFAALACASLIPGSTASAEVPQIDVENWLLNKPEQLAAIEQHLLRGESLSAFRAIHPERVNLRDRFRQAGRVPNFLIHTNPGDQSYNDQKNLIEWITESDLPTTGAELLVTTRLNGHTHYQGTAGLKFIRPGEQLIQFPILPPSSSKQSFGKHLRRQISACLRKTLRQLAASGKDVVRWLEKRSC